MTGLKRGTVRLTVHQDEWIYEAENTIKELKEGCGGLSDSRTIQIWVGI